MAEKTALIVGASRGLGLGLAAEHLKRGWRVVGTVRGEGTKLHDLARRAGGRLEIETVDITDAEAIAALRRRLDGRSFDLLFVVAGITNDPEAPMAQVSTDEFTQVMVTNVLGPIRVVEAFDSLVAPTGTIAVMSSGLGSVSRNTWGSWEVYRASKAALDTSMRSYAARAAKSRILRLMDPGWVRTDMGGPQASISVEESAADLADVLERSREPGLRFLDRHGGTVPW